MSWREYLTGDLAALLTKDRQTKDEFIREFASRRKDVVLYLHPRRGGMKLEGVASASYEDLTRRDVWLRINSLVSDDTVVILENPSRYAKITSEKVRRLRRLTQPLRVKAIVDIVPFTEDVQWLYTPYAYLDRRILGYAHYYAFRENYSELQEDGSILAAHDPRNLARKIAPVTWQDYDRFRLPGREIVPCPATAAEHARYQERKAELFAREKNPLRIVTRLADLTHTFDSRLDKLLELLSNLKGKTAVFTNLKTYAKRADGAALCLRRNDIYFGSYASHRIELSDCEHLVYLESPIVDGYLLMDVEAAVPTGCRVWHFLSDANVDIYLHGKISRELEQIDALTRALREEQDGRRAQALSSQERA